MRFFASSARTWVNLSLLSRPMSLRHHHLGTVATNPGPQLRDQSTGIGLSNPDAFLIDQPLPDTASGMTLLPRRVQIFGQPTTDRGHMRTRHRRRTRCGRARRRHRITQCLTHRAPMNPMTHSLLTDRHIFIPTLTSDTFELLLARSLLQTPTPLVNALANDTNVEDW